jgi:hypothetical protein
LRMISSLPNSYRSAPEIEAEFIAWRSPVPRISVAASFHGCRQFSKTSAFPRFRKSTGSEPSSSHEPASVETGR